MKNGFKIDETKCTKCGLCVSDCFSKAIVQEENKIPEMKNPMNCTKCEHCFAICPTGAISILNKNPEDSSKIREINPEDVINLIQSRRTVRNYKQENVDKETIKKLKDMLNYTPTGRNNHKLHFSFIEDINVMDDFRTKVNNKILSILNNKPMEIFSKVSDKFSKYKEAFENGNDILFRTAPHLVVVSVPLNAPCRKEDGIIALSYFELYANSLGLGTTWCGLLQGVLNNLPEFSEYLRIPDMYAPVYVMLFGYSNVKYQRTIQPREYEFTTIEEHECNSDLLTKAKRYTWNLFGGLR